MRRAQSAGEDLSAAKKIPPTSFSCTVLEDIHYIIVPGVVNESSVPEIGAKLEEWVKYKVQLHVFDFGSCTQWPTTFPKLMKEFANKLKKGGGKLVSINLSDLMFLKVKQAGAEAAFNRVRNINEDLSKKKKTLSETEIRRLLFKYLAQGAFKAVEVALHSTVSCDENYSVKPEELKLDQFDMITVIQVNNDFLKADFRLISSSAVLDKLCRAMHGNGADVDTELIESMGLELLNMVYGFAKSNLNDKEDFRLPPAIPKLIRKADFGGLKRSTAPDLSIMPVVTPMGSFYVEVDFAPKT